VAGRIRSIEKSNYLIGNGTGDLPACSIVPQPTTLPRAPIPIRTFLIEIDYNIVATNQTYIHRHADFTFHYTTPARYPFLLLGATAAHGEDLIFCGKSRSRNIVEI
jgi:hypothetical protein